MDARLVVLKKILDVLAVPADVTGLDARKAIQKAIYLTQASGLQLGYGYGWYLRGPYSTSLARDYYAMALALRMGEVAAPDLRTDVQTKLDPIKGVLNVPAATDLSQPDWLELLASVHFLRTVRGLDDSAAGDVLVKEKPALASHRPRAVEALQQAGLLP